MQARTNPDERTCYYLKSAEYVGSCTAPSGVVHLARLCFVRSGVRGQATPPPRGHTFIVFLDSDLRVRGQWEVSFGLGRLAVRESQLLLNDAPLLDFAHPPTSGHIVVDGDLQAVPLS